MASAAPPAAPAAPYYTADEIVRTVAARLADSTPPVAAEALRWLKEGLTLLQHAKDAGPEELERVLAEPVSTTGDLRWDTLIAACIRYRLRQLDVKAPSWTFKEPLAEMWFISGALPSRVMTAVQLAPMELRRVGIMLPEIALQP